MSRGEDGEGPTQYCFCTTEPGTQPVATMVMTYTRLGGRRGEEEEEDRDEEVFKRLDLMCPRLGPCSTVRGVSQTQSEKQREREGDYVNPTIKHGQPKTVSHCLSIPSTASSNLRPCFLIAHHEVKT